MAVRVASQNMILKVWFDEFPELDLMIAGNVANTNIYSPTDKQSHIDCQKMFAEQIAWAKEANVDFVIAETISWTEEAKLALKEIADKRLATPYKDGAVSPWKDCSEIGIT